MAGSLLCAATGGPHRASVAYARQRFAGEGRAIIPKARPSSTMRWSTTPRTSTARAFSSLRASEPNRVPAGCWLFRWYRHVTFKLTRKTTICPLIVNALVGELPLLLSRPPDC
jgi:hypothetical protein